MSDGVVGVSEHVVVGLTGGIAAGKSEVARMFEHLGAAVVDADQIARELVAPPSELLNEIVSQFGTSILEKDGSLNRHALAKIIFRDDQAKERLEKLMHPAIAAASSRRISTLIRGGAQVIVYEAALLVETGRYRDFDALVVVDAPFETRRARLEARDQLSPEAAEARIRSQMSASQKVALADYVIHNGGDLNDTRQQVAGVHRQLRAKLASPRP